MTQYKLILETHDDFISNELFRTLWANILGGEGRRERYRYILEKGIKDNHVKTPKQKFLSYYLLFTAFILDNKQSEFYNTLQIFEDYAKEYKGEPIRETIKLEFGIDRFESADVLKDKKTSIGKVWKLIP